jgi:putative transposase
LYILNDLSCFVFGWTLCVTMKARDVKESLRLALEFSCCDQLLIDRRPSLLRDNGASYFSGKLANWFEAEDIAHASGASHHPQTQGKIEH